MATTFVGDPPDPPEPPDPSPFRLYASAADVLSSPLTNVLLSVMVNHGGVHPLLHVSSPATLQRSFFDSSVKSVSSYMELISSLSFPLVSIVFEAISAVMAGACSFRTRRSLLVSNYLLSSAPVEIRSEVVRHLRFGAYAVKNVASSNSQPSVTRAQLMSCLTESGNFVAFRWRDMSPPRSDIARATEPSPLLLLSGGPLCLTNVPDHVGDLPAIMVGDGPSSESTRLPPTKTMTAGHLLKLGLGCPHQTFDFVLYLGLQPIMICKWIIHSLFWCNKKIIRANVKGRVLKLSSPIT